MTDLLPILTLTQRQHVFSRLVCRLIFQANYMGFDVQLGEAWRPPEMALIYAKAGKGIHDSLHCDRLAIDLNLFKGDQWLSSPSDYQPLGEWWEAQSTQQYRLVWGGRFRVHDDHGNLVPKPDAFHFSLSYDGRF